jgi:hypothetical protein
MADRKYYKAMDFGMPRSGWAAILRRAPRKIEYLDSPH